MPAITYVLGYLALLVTGHSVCVGESCFKSVQVVAGIFYMHWYCLQLYPFCFCFVLVKMTVPIMWAYCHFVFSLSSSPWRLVLR